MAKWKGFKVEWRDQECRFTEGLTLGPWFKPLRWSNGDLGRFEFLRELEKFSRSKEPLGMRMPAGFTFTALKTTTGGVNFVQSNRA